MSDTLDKTVHVVVLDLLQYIGVTGFSPAVNANALNRPGLDYQDIDKALSAVNQALEEINKLGPVGFRQQERAAFFHAPQPLSVDVTHGAGFVFPDLETWMIGCTVVISGDAVANKITDIVGTEATTLRGYTGATAAGIPAVVYGDVAMLEADVRAVVEPVTIDRNCSLRRATREQMTRLHYQFQTATRPSRYYADRRRDGYVTLALTPPPGDALNVTYTAALRSETVTTEALGLDGTDPGVLFETVNGDDVDSVLLPIARWKFFAHPALKNSEARLAVKAQYDLAMMHLTTGRIFAPSVGPSHARYI